jgi:carbamate kinase
MLTDVAAVIRDFGSYAALPISRATASQLRAMSFTAGSMAPKVEAACRFVEAGGKRAAIGNLTDAAAIVRGCAGTQVTRDGKTELRTLLAGGLSVHPIATQLHGGG